MNTKLRTYTIKNKTTGTVTCLTKNKRINGKIFWCVIRTYKDGRVEEDYPMTLKYAPLFIAECRKTRTMTVTLGV